MNTLLRGCLIVAGACLVLADVRAVEPSANLPDDYQLLYSQDFSSPDSLNDFVFTDPDAWKLSSVDGKTALELVKQSKYQPPYRSPVNIALVAGKVFGDVIVEADCMQTGKEYGHRDMVLFFGFQEPSKYYYTHIATKADEHANQIFIVNGAPRLKISKESNNGNNWGLNVWRHVRLERQASSGLTKVFFEDMNKPIMIAEDKTFGPGWLGFGSFDDTGKIANIKVWGKSMEEKQVPSFPPQ
jgi:hypothetical protein